MLLFEFFAGPPVSKKKAKKRLYIRQDVRNTLAHTTNRSETVDDLLEKLRKMYDNLKFYRREFKKLNRQLIYRQLKRELKNKQLSEQDVMYENQLRQLLNHAANRIEDDYAECTRLCNLVFDVQFDEHMRARQSRRRTGRY